MKRQSTPISSSMTELLELYKSHLVLGKSEQTVEAFVYDNRKFTGWLADHGVKRAGSIKTAHITRYLSHCRESGKMDSSVVRYLTSIKSFCRFLRKQKVMKEDVTEDVPVPMQKTKPPKVPTRQEMELLLQQPDVATESGLRDRAIMELMYSSGLRATELCELKLADFRNNQITVTCGKGNKTRCVPVTEEAAHWVSLYIEKHRAGASYAERYNNSMNSHLFITEIGSEIQRQLLCKKIVRYAKQAGLQEVTPHTLRHACATHLLDEGADLRLIQEVLGHASINSTQIYTHLSSNTMQKMFHQFHPRRKEAVCIG